MSESTSISSGIAGRYAAAVFELAKEDGRISGLESDVDAIDAGLTASADLRDLIASPILSRDEQEGAIAAVASAMGLSETFQNLLRLMARKRRLFVLHSLVRVLREAIAEEKGEVTAEVRAAAPLSEAQSARLVRALGKFAGRDVRINMTVDESLIGGLVVQVGSKMIDTTVRAKLDAMKNIMKEVG